jgi:outer membrane protein OmpA-like peptidoglycan-associated protein
MVSLVAVVAMTALAACGGGKKMKLVVERETVIHAPIIQSVSIDGPARLDTREQGHTVGVRLIGDPGLSGTFDVGGMTEGLPLSEGPEGVYRGSFQVPQGATGTIGLTGHLVHSPTGANAAITTAAALELYLSEKRPRSDCPESVAQAFDAQLQKLTVYFTLDSSDLPEEAQQQLRDGADLLNSNSLCKIFVLGHTDHSGTERYNVVLSALRAINVGRFLESVGVDLKRLEKHPMGTRYPENKGETKEQEAENRRVEIRAVHPYP